MFSKLFTLGILKTYVNSYTKVLATFIFYVKDLNAQTHKVMYLRTTRFIF